MAGISFVFLRDELCDPLWFNVLDFTTKGLKGLHKGHKGLFQQPPKPSSGVVKAFFRLLLLLITDSHII
jgi:hypothetical protein